MTSALLSPWGRTRQGQVFPSCVRCGLTGSPHAANGLCNQCYLHDWQVAHRKRPAPQRPPRPWGKTRGGRVLEACDDCHRTARPHRGNGLCIRCYNKRKRAGLTVNPREAPTLLWFGVPVETISRVYELDGELVRDVRSVATGLVHYGVPIVGLT